MSRDPQNRLPPLSLVSKGSPSARSGGGKQGGQEAVHEIDWSILMARAQSGDGTAYRRLLEEMTPFLRSLAARRHAEPSDIEDAVQDILLTVHVIRNTYDPTRPFGPWLVTIAHRRITDRLRRCTCTKSRETPLTLEHETVAAPPANLLETRSDGRALRKAVESLSPGQRQAIRLLKLKEMSLKEAAAVSGMSVASLKVATHRALSNLRRILAKRSDRA